MDDRMREATLDDVDLLVLHRRQMMAEISTGHGRTYSPADWAQSDALYREYVERQLKAGTMRAWVIEVDGQVLASGAASVVDWPASPRLPSPCQGHIHSMYTAPDARRRGYARRIVEAAIAWCREQGVRRITLGASDWGRSVYEALGFVATPRSMRLDI